VLIGIIALAALIISCINFARGGNSSNQSPQTSCLNNAAGTYLCSAGSYCVGIKGFSQASSEYYTSASNGIEFDKIEYLQQSANSAAPTSYFMHMTIHGGCSQTPCGFNENELYTAVPGTVNRFEGFTVNRTGANTGMQAFYETLTFDATCNSYVKIVKGQLVGNPLAPAAVLCHNECKRVPLSQYNTGIQGGYVLP
jgi:hypothetical protein